ncbi:MAG: CinA family protein [Candidatus Izemoplasmatales bacterium]
MSIQIVEEISRLAKKLIDELTVKNQKISFAESVTGGLLSSSLTKEVNASKIFEMGFIVYSNTAKEKILNVNKNVIEKEGVYSIATVEEMLQGLEDISKADILIAVSGIAGPDEIIGHKIGEAYIGIKINNSVQLYKKQFIGTRELIQLEIVKFCFTEILTNL